MLGSTAEADKVKGSAMKKMTKKDRVENYLDGLMKSEEFSVENLMNMTVYDLFGNTELDGIGKTTLSGALNSFKKRYGLKKAGKGGVIMHKNTKKERVERYLANLMKTDDFTVDDLMNLTVYDLFGNAELEGIGKTTLSSGISAFKKKYLKIQYDEKAAEAGNFYGASESSEISDDEEQPIDDLETFENVVISTLEREGEMENGSGSSENKGLTDNLNANEIDTLKSMIKHFKDGQIDDETNSASMELSELKRALKHFGIEYKTIISQYRKNVEN
ncbi:MAG: hypothetical protein MJE63_22785 [Proteobacteria bacterium]|nr:hypothetical protein [Pseudomonadota bacterium]